LIFLVHTINQIFSLISAKNNINQKSIIFVQKCDISRNASRNQVSNYAKQWNALMWRLSLTILLFYLFLYSKIPWLWRILEKIHFSIQSRPTYLAHTFYFLSHSSTNSTKQKSPGSQDLPTKKKNNNNINNQTTPNSILKNVFDGTKQQQNQNCNITVQKKFKKKSNQISSSFRYWTDKANEFSEFIPYQCYKIVHFELDFLFYLNLLFLIFTLPGNPC